MVIKGEKGKFRFHTEVLLSKVRTESRNDDLHTWYRVIVTVVDPRIIFTLSVLGGMWMK